MQLLYVEDSPEEWEPITRALKRDEIDVVTVRTLGEAIGLLNGVDAFDGILIDLLLPLRGLPTELKGDVAALGPYAPNTGQALGRWLRRRKPQQCYAYFTVSTRNFDAAQEQGHASYKGVIDKATSDAAPNMIAQTVRKTFGWIAVLD